MCSGVGLTGFLIALVSGELGNGCPRSVLLGGALWALSNYAVIPLVKILGIGLGFSLYHFVGISVGYLTGRLGLFGVAAVQPMFEGSLYISDFGCFLVAVSFVVIMFVEAEEGAMKVATSLKSPEQPLESGITGNAASVADGVQRAAGLARNGITSSFGSFNVLATVATNKAHVELFERKPERAENGSAMSGEPVPSRAVDTVDFNLGKWRLPIGVLLAVVGGSLSAVQNIPATVYMQQHKKAAPSAVVFPQCLGIWAASSSIYLLYSGFARLRKWKVQHSVIRPSYFAGCIWACGFFGSITGISLLGFSTGFTIASVGPIVVASILSIFVFKEIQGRRPLMLYCVAELLQLVGVLLVATFGKQAD